MDHQIAAAERKFRIRQRRKFRAVDHAGKKSSFLNFQVGDWLAKIKLRSGCKTIVTMRQINLIGVHRKDLRFGVAPLDLQGEQNFLHFAAEAAVAAVQEKIVRQLHGDGAGAAGDAALVEISDRGAEDALEVDPPGHFEVLGLDAAYGGA